MPYKEHDIFKAVAKEQPLWRYMNFAKFIDLFLSKRLYFSSLGQLHNDPWEGLLPKGNYLPDRLVPCREVGPTKSDGVEEVKVVLRNLKDMLGNHCDDYLKHQKQASLELRKTCFVNCWHMNDGESDSQWKIYGGDPCSLAIVTSFERLQHSIIDPLDIYGSQVIYYDPNKDIVGEGNILARAICKRQAFVHEKEFRLVHWDHSLLTASPCPSGILIAVDLGKMVESIVISPMAPEWFVNTVKNFMETIELVFPLSKSSLLDPLILE